MRPGGADLPDKYTDGPAVGGSKFAAAASKLAGAPLGSCWFVSMDATAKPSFGYGSRLTGRPGVVDFGSGEGEGAALAAEHIHHPLARRRCAPEPERVCVCERERVCVCV